MHAALAAADRQPPTSYTAFVADPLSSWIESVFGVTHEVGTGRLVRSVPRNLRGEQGAGGELSQLSGVSEEACAFAIQRWLLGPYEEPI